MRRGWHCDAKQIAVAIQHGWYAISDPRITIGQRIYINELVGRRKTERVECPVKVRPHRGGRGASVTCKKPEVFQRRNGLSRGPAAAGHNDRDTQINPDRILTPFSARSCFLSLHGSISSRQMNADAQNGRADERRED
jgi:hypothetical protein